MRILGVDPGTVVVGWACLDVADPDVTAGAMAAERPLAHRAGNVVRATGGSRGSSEVVGFGVLRLGRSATGVHERLGRLADGLAELLVRLRPDQLAVECAFAGRSVQSALRIGEARGVVLAEAWRRGVAVDQLTPSRVKRAVTGNGSADKAAVAAMVQRLLGLPEPPRPHDAADALAVAIASAEQRWSLRARAEAADSGQSRR